MGERALASFWAATAASALLLGSTWSLKDRVGQPGFGLWDVALFGVAAVGFCATFLIAARIAFVAGRIKRLRRAERLGEGLAPMGSSILVVDDERKIRELVRSYLELEGTRCSSPTRASGRSSRRPVRTRTWSCSTSDCPISRAREVAHLLFTRRT